ncbi:MAG: hypothetical protein KJ703_11045 [Alphaproteobacteria bacterium]|nr:hypothetical protein [Alphaproteobacteria bacterium]MBU1757493.1 hypothetical protein [Alphaproteobacteria bacterium]
MTALLSATLLLALQSAGAPAPTPTPALSLEQQSGLRCAAAFALVAQAQAAGDTEALEYPALGERGREFFVRTAARLIDETGLDRVGVARMLSAEAARLAQEEGALDRAMPPCLMLLEASGL